MGSGFRGFLLNPNTVTLNYRAMSMLQTGVKALCRVQVQPTLSILSILSILPRREDFSHCFTSPDSSTDYKHR